MENSAVPKPSLRRGRQPYLLPQEAKRRRLERYRLRRQRMVHVGLEVERWHELRAELGLENDASLAKCLLDNYRSCHTYTKLGSNPNTGGKAFGFRNESSTASSTSFSGNQRKRAFQTSEPLKIPQLLSAVGLSRCDSGDDSDDDEDSSNFTEDSTDMADYLLPDSFASSKLKDYTVEEEVLNFIDDEVISGEEGSVPILVASTKVKSIHRMRTGIVFDACLMSLARKAFSTCEIPDCKSKVDLQLHIVATAMKVIGHCGRGHESTWWSQPLVQTIPAGNIQLASSIVLSGNNYGKIALMLKFLNMLPIGQQSFLKLQKTHIQPSVLNYWRTMQAKHFRELAQPVVVVAHQCRNVRALSKKYLTYTMMDNATHKILEVQVIDVQNDAKKLQNLEVSGFQQVFRRLMQNNLSISEVVTKADTELMSLMKLKYPNVLHQIDLWYGIRAVHERLEKVASPTDNRDLQPWIKDIVRHFIYCCQYCRGDAKTLMARWRSILHHTVNMHEWQLGDGSTAASCEHGPLADKELKGKKWLMVGSPAHHALREVVYDKWLTSHLCYFVQARVTDELESFNNHIKIYAAKDFTYEYKDYQVRILLAAIDYNSHIERESQRSITGEIIYRKMYSKHNRNWRVLPLQVKKQYRYFEDLQEDILRAKLPKDTVPDQPKCLRTRSMKAQPGTGM